jgi:hypothetical protein
MNDEKLLNIVTAAETQVKSARGVLHAIILNKANGAALTVYDNTSTAGTKLATIAASTPAGSSLLYHGRFMTGLRIVNGDGVKAHSTITSNASPVTAGKKVTIGTTVYTFRATCTAPYDVKAGANAAASLDNLKLAINAGTLSAGEYGVGTLAHPDVTAEDNADTTQKVVARVAGTAGNAIATTTDDATLGWTSTVLGSGAEGTAFDLTVSYS